MEKLMQYVWRFRLWPDLSMTGSDGRRVDIIDPGTLNTGSGPDFFNAKVRIDGRMWAGNIEIHVHASDWKRHGHHLDPAYDNVILHVVHYDDCEVRRRTDSAVIPQVVMNCAPDFAERYNAMVHNPLTELPCAAEIASVPRIMVSDWITALAFERIQRKADDIARLLDLYRGDWNEAAYVTLARGLGFGSNADAMEMLARSVSLRTLLHHSDSLSAIEAILMGRAGLLAQKPRDEYEALLVQEYAFYSKKFSIEAPVLPSWNARQRPLNSPVRRVAALAALIHNGFETAGRIFGLSSPAQLPALFDVMPSPYWLSHMSFGRPSGNIPSLISPSAVRLLAINVVAPLLYAFGERTGDAARCETAVDLLRSVKAEDNSIVRIFCQAGLDSPDAFTSQAFIQLRKEYCTARKCLYCRIGHRLLAAKAKA